MSLSEGASSPKQANLTPKKIPNVGPQTARCIGIYDLGKQPSSFNGIPGEPKPKITMVFEVPKFLNETKEGKKYPCVVYQDYTFSAGSKAKLPAILAVWAMLPKTPEKIGVDLLKKFLGKTCSLTIVHQEDKTGKKYSDGTPVKYANIADKGRSINPLSDEIPEPQKYNEPVFFDLDTFTWEAFRKLPKFIQEKIRKSVEFPSIVQKMPEPAQESAMQPSEEFGIVANDDDLLF